MLVVSCVVYVCVRVIMYVLLLPLLLLCYVFQGIPARRRETTSQYSTHISVLHYRHVIGGSAGNNSPPPLSNIDDFYLCLPVQHKNALRMGPVPYVLQITSGKLTPNTYSEYALTINRDIS